MPYPYYVMNVHSSNNIWGMKIIDDFTRACQIGDLGEIKSIESIVKDTQIRSRIFTSINAWLALNSLSVDAFIFVYGFLDDSQLEAFYELITDKRDEKIAKLSLGEELYHKLLKQMPLNGNTQSLHHNDSFIEKIETTDVPDIESARKKLKRRLELGPISSMSELIFHSVRTTPAMRDELVSDDNFKLLEIMLEAKESEGFLTLFNFLKHENKFKAVESLMDNENIFAHDEQGKFRMMYLIHNVPESRGVIYQKHPERIWQLLNMKYRGDKPFSGLLTTSYYSRYPHAATNDRGHYIFDSIFVIKSCPQELIATFLMRQPAQRYFYELYDTDVFMGDLTNLVISLFSLIPISCLAYLTSDLFHRALHSGYTEVAMAIYSATPKNERKVLLVNFNLRQYVHKFKGRQHDPRECGFMSKLLCHGVVYRQFADFDWDVYRYIRDLKDVCMKLQKLYQKVRLRREWVALTVLGRAVTLRIKDVDKTSDDLSIYHQDSLLYDNEKGVVKMNYYAFVNVVRHVRGLNSFEQADDFSKSLPITHPTQVDNEEPIEHYNLIGDVP